MHNIKTIRQNPEAFDKAMRRRGLSAISGQILDADSQKRENIGDLQTLQQRSNEIAKEIGALMGQGKRDEAQPLMAESKEIKAKLAVIKNGDEAEKKDDPVTKILETLPNIMDDDVPAGETEDNNVELRREGDPRSFDFTPKAHYEIGENLKAATLTSQMEFEQSVAISGTRFVTLKGDLAKLQRALSNFIMDVHISENDYEEVAPALLVRSEAMYGADKLPKFADDAFQTTDGRWLIPTSEVALVNQVNGLILDEDSLPYRFAAYTPNFRSEAGSAGKDTRGMVRVHQFNKVELVTITTPEHSEEEHKRKLACSETILQRLGLPYRVMLLCEGDTGFGARKTYDIEVWLPAQDTYREICSVSNCGDFQARRMNTRSRSKEEKNTRFVHTLNGTAIAVTRGMVALIENYQNADGSVNVPEVLVPYMGGQKVIK